MFIFKDTNVGDEGGFAPDLTSVEECLNLLVETIEKCGYTGNVKIALDVAASGTFIPQNNFIFGDIFRISSRKQTRILWSRYQKPIRNWTSDFKWRWNGWVLFGSDQKLSK